MNNNKTDPTSFPYLHGFSAEEQDRLKRQARFGEHLIYNDLDLSGVKRLLEVGCGVGAQSEILLRRFPDISLVSIDMSDLQLSAAKKNLESVEIFKNRYQFEKMDAGDMTFKENEFDGAFLCWILEHVPSPSKVISEVRRVLRPGGRVFITEVMNSSFFLEPYSPNVWKYWMIFNDYQYEKAGDPFIGAKLGNLLLSAGYKNVSTQIKTWHYDNRFPGKRRETIEYWTELLLSGSGQLLNEKKVTKELITEVKKELDGIKKDPNAVFLYSFFQATGTVE